MRNTKRYTRRRLNYVKVVSVAVIVIVLSSIFTISACSTKYKTDVVISAALPKTKNVLKEPEQAGSFGGQLKIYIPKSVSSLNPLNVSSKEMKNALSLVYEPLIRYDSENRLSPSLAESWEKVNDTESMVGNEAVVSSEIEANNITETTKWRFNLRKGVFWHNSETELTASDVSYTIALLKTQEYENSVYAQNIDEIVRIAIIDDYTMIIEAKGPGSRVLHALTIPIVSRQYFALQKQPIGTGPYIMTYAEKNRGLEFSVNESWWKKIPYIPSVIALVGESEDNASAISGLQAGQYNYVQTSSTTANMYRDAGRIGLLELNTQNLETMIVNHSNYLLQDINIRKAIMLAIDKREIISKAYLEHASAVDIPVSPDSWLYNVSGTKYDYNIESAKKVLSDDGWKDSNGLGYLSKNEDGGMRFLEFSLLVNDSTEDPVRKDVALLIQSQLAKVGIKVNIIYAPWTDAENEYQRALSAGAFDLALVGFNINRSADLSSLLSETSEKNYARYKDANMQELLDIVSRTANEKDLKENFNNVLNMFTSELPFFALYFRTSSALYDESLVISNDIRETDPFFAIEKWYFDPNRVSTAVEKHFTTQPRWEQFDVPNYDFEQN